MNERADAEGRRTSRRLLPADNNEGLNDFVAGFEGTNE